MDQTVRFVVGSASVRDATSSRATATPGVPGKMSQCHSARNPVSLAAKRRESDAFFASVKFVIYRKNRGSLPRHN